MSETECQWSGILSLNLHAGAESIQSPTISELSHEGIAANDSLDLENLIECPLYLVWNNGSRHHHPDHDAIARMIWA